MVTRHGRCAGMAKRGLPPNDTFGPTRRFFCLICRYELSCSSCKAATKNSASKIGCEAKHRSVGTLTRGPGWSLDPDLQSGQRPPRSETRPNVGLSLPARARVSFSRGNNWKTQNPAKRKRPCGRAPRREESSLSGNRGASHSPAAARVGAGWVLARGGVG